MNKLFLTFSFSLAVILVSSLVSCGNNTNDTQDVSADSLFQQHDSIFAHADEYSDTVQIKYAQGLKVEYVGDSIHITISNPDPSVKHSKKEELNILNPSLKGSHAKKNTFICTTALQLGNFEILGLEDRIVGMNSLKNLFSPKMKAQMESGKTVKIGKEGNFDLECVIAAKPDYIFVSASKHGGFEALKECGIPLISHHGYKEADPLGQAEWIKLIGLLTGETKRANALFADIEMKYNKLKKEVAADSMAAIPTVASGRQVRDGWYVVGGKSYMAQIFKDAGANYIYSDNEEAEGVTHKSEGVAHGAGGMKHRSEGATLGASGVALESGGVTLDFEAAYAKSVGADFWQIDGTFDGDYTLASLAEEDSRYAEMKAYKDKKVLFCNFSQTPYRELSPVEPHIILADFVKAFHPEILPKYQPKYYKLIK